MKMSNKVAISSFIFALVFLLSGICNAQTTTTQANSEISVNVEGNAVMKNVKVAQVAGATFYTRLIWGTSFVRLVVKTTPATKIYRKYGEIATVSEVKLNDFINITGELETGSDSLTIIADQITDLSILTKASTFSGTVSSIDSSAQNFVMKRKSGDSVTVSVTSATITKGSLTIGLDQIKVGDSITNVSGVYDYGTNTIKADKIIVYIDKAIFLSQNYQGTLRIINQTMPPTFVVTVGSTDYTIKTSSQTQFLNKNKENVALKRFVEGDTVRIYGAREEVIPYTTIDAEVVRNLNL